jgi:electron transfer flavoprotein beta subunit
MKVLVFLEIGADVRIAPVRDPRSGRVREEWLVRELDPGSARALDLALSLKAAHPAVEVTAVHFGPPDAEPWLRQALARGCDGSARVWDTEVAEARAAGKAVILAAAARPVGFDLILAGSSGVLEGSGQFGVLLAAQLGVPAVTQVIDATVGDDARMVRITRGLYRGFRERVEATLPVVATVAAGPEVGATAPADIPVSALLKAQGAAIPVWTPADLGVPLERVRRADGALRAGAPRPIRPRLRPLAAPDPTLPAFERILSLVQGAVQRREGRVVRKAPEEIVEEVFTTLRDEGWLGHLRPGAGGVGRGPRRAGTGDQP